MRSRIRWTTALARGCCGPRVELEGNDRPTEQQELNSGSDQVHEAEQRSQKTRPAEPKPVALQHAPQSSARKNAISAPITPPQTIPRAVHSASTSSRFRNSASAAPSTAPTAAASAIVPVGSTHTSRQPPALLAPSLHQAEQRNRRRPRSSRPAPVSVPGAGSTGPKSGTSRRPPAPPCCGRASCRRSGRR
jgi:hypothetical protein